MRTAFTLNTALKRLFLSSTQLTSAGAIALAEFLPESASLVHLDLTVNTIDLAGVMALSKGLKSNHVMRCLDLNIPPDNDTFASICREILNTCVRNTEEAGRATKGGAEEQGGAASGKGLGKGVWGLIEESELARSIRMGDGLPVKVRPFCMCIHGWSEGLLVGGSIVACRGAIGTDPSRDFASRFGRGCTSRTSEFGDRN